MNLQNRLRRAPRGLLAAMVLAGALVFGPRPAGAAAPLPDPEITALNQRLADAQVAVTSARAGLLAASVAQPLSAAGLRAKVEDLQRTEKALADLQADYFALLEAHLDSLSPEQVGSLAQEGLHAGMTANAPGEPINRSFHEPDPLDFGDHAGFTQIFDGATLQGWDGDPTIWSVQDGAIVGVSSREHPVRNSYISYHGTAAKDFDLKLELKVIDRGGSGIQYRSAVGLPWNKPLPPGAAPPNLQWMMTGPQADFWPAKPYYSGQFYSENTPLGIVAWRGEVVSSVAGHKPRLVGRIGNRTELGTYVANRDWNQYQVIARGGTMLHIINGQLMAVEIDDDPASSNNASGLIGIEIESFPGVVSVRNIWLRKLQ